MKKKILAGVLAIASAVSVFSLSACVENENDNDGGLDKDTVETIIKDEETWNKAFENIEYTNFSIRVKIKFPEMKEPHINYVEVTPNAVYYNIESQTEFYSVKQENGTCKTYLKGWDIYNDFKEYPQTYFTVLSNSSSEYLLGAQTETVFKVSYADYFDLFTYDKENAAYTYNGVIETTAYAYDGSEIGELYCTNTVIKVENNKIVYIRSDYTRDNFQEEGIEESFEYFNIGSTVVKVPEEVIANAVQEEEKK